MMFPYTSKDLVKIIASKNIQIGEELLLDYVIIDDIISDEKSNNKIELQNKNKRDEDNFFDESGSESDNTKTREDKIDDCDNNELDSEEKDKYHKKQKKTTPKRSLFC